MKYSLVPISNQRYQAMEFVDRPVPEKLDSFRIYLSCVFFTKHAWHFEYVVGYITIPDLFFPVSTEKNACIFSMSAKQDGNVYIEASLWTCFNQSEKKKRRKLKESRCCSLDKKIV